MYTTVTVKQLLNHKGYDVWSVSPDTSVFEALQLMAEKNIGALIVLDDEEPVGIFSERDYARKVTLKGKKERETPVQEVMTGRLIGVGLQHTLPECMALMTGKFIRHLPVIDDGKIIGVISIGDIVKEIIAEQNFIIDQLVNYISGEASKPPLTDR